jgi:hypothetical protein
MEGSFFINNPLVYSNFPYAAELQFIAYEGYLMAPALA